MNPAAMNGGYVAGRRQGDFRIFISFAGNDNIGGELTAFVERLKKSVDDARGTPDSVVFFSDENIGRGEIWRDRLDREIAAADLFVPVVSQSFFYSKYCARELAAYLALGTPAEEASAGRPIMPLFWMDAAEVPEADLQGNLSILRRPPGERLLRRMLVSDQDAFNDRLDDLGYEIAEYHDTRRPAVRGGAPIGEAAAFRWDRRPAHGRTAYADGVFRIVVGYGENDNSRGLVDRFVTDLRAMYAKVSGRRADEFTFAAVSPSSPTAAAQLTRADAYILLLSPTLLHSAACSRQLSAFLLMYQKTVALSRAPDNLVYPLFWKKCPWLPVQFDPVQIKEINKEISSDRNFSQYQRNRHKSSVYDEELEKLAGQLDEGAKREDGLERGFPLDVSTRVRAWDRYYSGSTFTLFRVGVTRTALPHFEQDGAFASRREGELVRFYADSVENWDPYRQRGGDLSYSQLDREMFHAAKRLRMRRVEPFRDNFCADMMTVGSADVANLDLSAGEPDLVVLSVDPWLLQHDGMRDVLTSVCARHAGPRVVVAPLSQLDGAVSNDQRRGQFLEHMRNSFGPCGQKQEFIGDGLETVDDFAAGVYAALKKWARRSPGSSGGRSFNPGTGDGDDDD